MASKTLYKRKRTGEYKDDGFDSDSDTEIRTFVTEGWARYILVKAANEDRPLTALSPFAICKGFQEIHSGLKDVKRQRDGSFLVQCTNRKESELLLKRNNQTFVDRPIKVEAHRSLNSSKGVIHCKDLAGLTEGTIKEELAEQGVIDVHRCLAKREGKTVPTNTYFLTFCLPRIPESIKIGYLRVKVTLYVPTPMRCFHCQKFGHTKTRCRSETEICVKCGKPKHDDDCQPKCANCEGEHAANSRECPQWKQESAIQRVRAEQKVSFGEAKKIINTSNPPTNLSTQKSFAQAASKIPQTVLEQPSSSLSSSLESTVQHLMAVVEKLTKQISSLETRLLTVTGQPSAGTPSPRPVTGVSAPVHSSSNRTGSGTTAPSSSNRAGSGTTGAGSSGGAPASSASSPKKASAVIVDVTKHPAKGIPPPPRSTSRSPRRSGGGRPLPPPKPSIESRERKGDNMFDVLSQMECQ